MRRALVAVVVLSATVAGAYAWRMRKPAPDDAGEAIPASASAKALAPAPIAVEEPPNDLHFRLPAGVATHVTCNEAQRIVAQVRSELSYDPDPIDDRELAAATGDWLDPHSFWSLPEDAPTQAVLDAAARQMIKELEGGDGACTAAHVVGKTLAAWSHALRERFDAGTKTPAAIEHAEEKELAAGGSTLERAEDLGRRAQAFRESAGLGAAPYVTATRDRFFPDYGEDKWADVVLAAAVRAYVPLIDPHGAWAPLDEKSSVYEVDLFADPPEKPWGRVTVTSVGFRIEDHATAPLQDGDVVLRVDGVASAGMPLEQIEQLGFACRQDGPASVVVSRGGVLSIVNVPLHSDNKGLPPPDLPEHLVVDHVPFGNQEVAIIAFQDVRDDLGDDIRDLIADLSREKTAGIVLDLRGNGGGSTDGAINALGHLIPNAPLFPTKRRDGTIEVDHSPANTPVWEGPVATLVDGSTASAAEMISGALMAYGRGPSVGATTFGKGCAQEYLDDEPTVGVLRLTTLLYALPDGTPVQRVGLTPTIKLPFLVKTDDPREREATLKHTAPTWRGPDKRNPSLFPHRESWAWPSHNGKFGPCEDADVCRALKALGSHRPQIAKNKADPH